VVLVSDWRSDGTAEAADPSRISIWAAAGRKP
jgi:hypothetical protein